MKKYEVMVNDPDDSIKRLFEYIKHLSTIGHTFEVVVDPNDNENKQSFEIDGDGCTQLLEINEFEIKNEEFNSSEFRTLANTVKSKAINKAKTVIDEEIIKEDEVKCKVTLSQKLKVDFTTDVEYDLDEDDLLYNIDFDETKFSQELLKYLKTYNVNDEFKDIYNSVDRVDTDFEGNKITIYLSLGMKVDNEKLRYIFDNFIEEVAMEDDQFSGSCNVEVEPFESEPYESGYNPMNDNILYDTSTIDEIEVDYSFETDGEQTIEIKQ